MAERSRLAQCAISSRWAQPTLSTKILHPRDLEIGSGKGLLQPRALSTIHLVQALVLFPPSMHCAHTLQWWSQKTVNPPIPVTGWLSTRLDISLNIFRGCQLPKFELRLRYPLFSSSDIRLFALCVVTNLRTVSHCTRSEGM